MPALIAIRLRIDGPPQQRSSWPVIGYQIFPKLRGIFRDDQIEKLV
jgi:hypothetical protein